MFAVTKKAHGEGQGGVVFPCAGQLSMQLQMQLKAIRKAMPYECLCFLDNLEPHIGTNAFMQASEHKMQR